MTRAMEGKKLGLGWVIERPHWWSQQVQNSKYLSMRHMDSSWESAITIRALSSM
jgi:hypothetical protein